MAYKTHHSSVISAAPQTHRSPIITGCCFACLLVVSLILISCSVAPTEGDPHPASVEKNSIDSTPQSNALQQTSTKNAITLPERVIPTEPLATGKPSLSSTVIPQISQNLAMRKSKPFLTSDLLYLSSNQLIRWDPLTYYGIPLAKKVVEFSTSASGKRIALLRQRGVVANGVELFDVDLLDLETMQIQHLLQDKSNISDIALSPDGRWLVFKESLEQAKLMGIQPDSPANIFEFGICIPEEELGCSVPVWSPDSKNLLWADARGLWITNPGFDKATKINPDLVTIFDPNGNPSKLEAEFSSPRWSPLGRFVLIRVSPTQSNVSWESVLDTRTGQMVQVDDSFEIKETDASLAWLSDGRIAVAHSNDPGLKRPATLQLWSVYPTHSTLLVHEQSIELDLKSIYQDVSLDEAFSSEDQVFCMEWLQQIDAAYLLMGIRILPNDSSTMLFKLDIEKGLLTPVAEISPRTKTVLWSPDGTGLLVFGEGNRITYLDLEKKELIDLPYSGEASPDLLWLPPMKRE